MESVCGEPKQTEVCIELALVVLLFETAGIEKSQRSARNLVHPYLFMRFADITDLLSGANILRRLWPISVTTCASSPCGGHNAPATSSEPALSQHLGKSR